MHAGLTIRCKCGFKRGVEHITDIHKLPVRPVQVTETHKIDVTWRCPNCGRIYKLDFSMTPFIPKAVEPAKGDAQQQDPPPDDAGKTPEPTAETPPPGDATPDTPKGRKGKKPWEK